MSQYKFYLHGKMIAPKDSTMKRHCKIRPNYDAVPLQTGDYEIVRYWINAKGKSVTTVIYSSVGSSDAQHIVRDLIRKAKEHFSIRLWQCEQNSYQKYTLTSSSVYVAYEEIKSMKTTIGGFSVHEPTKQEYLSRLDQWLHTTFMYEKNRFYMLLALFEDVKKTYDHWKHVDFLKLQEETRISEQEYTERLYTLQIIFKALCTIKLFERMIGYYLKPDALAMRKGE